jgi:hypothetical protein
MAGSKSNSLENLVLTWALTASAATRPSAWYVGLYTDASGLVNDQPTTEATTGVCPGYARQQVTSWTISGTNPTQAQNNQAVTFTATGAWSTVNYFGVFDALTAGNLLYWGSIPAKTLANTDQLQFGINQITITED